MQRSSPGNACNLIALNTADKPAEL